MLYPYVLLPVYAYMEMVGKFLRSCEWGDKRMTWADWQTVFRMCANITLSLVWKEFVLFESIAWPFDLVMEPEGEIAGGILHLPWLPLCTYRTEAHPPPRKTALEKDAFRKHLMYFGFINIDASSAASTALTYDRTQSCSTAGHLFPHPISSPLFSDSSRYS